MYVCVFIWYANFSEIGHEGLGDMLVEIMVKLMLMDNNQQKRRGLGLTSSNFPYRKD